MAYHIKHCPVSALILLYVGGMMLEIGIVTGMLTGTQPGGLGSPRTPVFIYYAPTFFQWVLHSL